MWWKHELAKFEAMVNWGSSEPGIWVQNTSILLIYFYKIIFVIPLKYVIITSSSESHTWVPVISQYRSPRVHESQYQFFPPVSCSRRCNTFWTWLMTFIINSNQWKSAWLISVRAVVSYFDHEANLTKGSWCLPHKMGIYYLILWVRVEKYHRFVLFWVPSFCSQKWLSRGWQKKAHMLRNMPLSSPIQAWTV